MTDETKKKLPWLKVVLAVSLGLNLLIAGAVVGAKMSGFRSDRVDDKGERLGFSVGPYGRALTKEDRREMRKAFVKRAPELRQDRRAMRGFGQDLVAALRQQPFDGDAITTILTKQLELAGDMQAVGKDVLAERISAMTPEARLAFADRLEMMLKRGPGGRRDK